MPDMPSTAPAGQCRQQILTDCDVLFPELAARRRLREPVGRLPQSAPGVAAELPDAVVGTRIISHSAPLSRGTSVAEQTDPAGGRHTNAERLSRDEGSLGTCLACADEAWCHRRCFWLSIRVIAFVESAEALEGFGRDNGAAEALRLDAQAVVERSALSVSSGLEIGA